MTAFFSLIRSDFTSFWLKEQKIIFGQAAFRKALPSSFVVPPYFRRCLRHQSLSKYVRFLAKPISVIIRFVQKLRARFLV